jgi:hypothetical protein
MPALDQAVLERLADQHQASLSRIQIAAENAAVSAWYRLNAQYPDDQDEQTSKAKMAAWAAVLWLITKPAADLISAETHQYMSAINAYVGIGPLLPPPSTEWFRDDFEGWVLSPVSKARVAMADPLVTGANQVSLLVSTATREAEQEAFRQIVESLEWETTFEFVENRPEQIIVAETVNDVRILAQREAIDQGYEVTQRNKTAKRWKRVTQAGACGFCQVLAGSTLYSDTARVDQGKAKAAPGKPSSAIKSKATGAYHAYCRCSWERLGPDAARKWERSLTGGEWRDVINERANVPESERNREM